MILLQLLAALSLMVLPGAWLTLMVREGSIGERWMLAIALSPLVAGIQFVLLRLAGLGFETATLVVILVNLGSLVLIRRWPWRAPSTMTTQQKAIAGLLFLAVAACVAIPWIAEPAFRRFSWHGLLHTDIIYAIARGGLPPEDPSLAGVTLSYPWLGHVWWAMISWALGISPTILYLGSNLVLLAVLGVFLFKTARELGAPVPLALAVPAALALGPDLPGLVGWSLIPPNQDGIAWALLGDLRTTPFVQKFVSFEAMTFGLALFGALLLLITRSAKRNLPMPRTVTVALILGIAALYPNLFPAALLVPGALLLVRFRAEFGGGWGTAIRRVGGGALILIAAAVLGALVIEFFIHGRSEGVLALSSLPAIAKKAVAAAIGLGPFALATGWLWRATDGGERAAVEALAWAAAGAIALNLLLRMGGLNEYKFFYAAGMCLMPPALVAFGRLWLSTPARQWTLAGVLPLLLALVMAGYTVHRVPRSGSTPLPVHAGEFHLGLAPAAAAAEWTEAVRTGTPLNTVLVVHRPDFVVSAFSDRSQYVQTERDRKQFGFNLSSYANLVSLRGYSQELVDRRVALEDQLYAPGTPDDTLTALVGELRSLGRPIALVVTPESGAHLQEWLDAGDVGCPLYTGTGGIVTILPAEGGCEQFAATTGTAP